MRLRVIILSILLLAVSGSGLVDAKINGKTGSTSGCTCHYGGGGFTPAIHGLPSGGWVGGTTYSLTWDNGGTWISGSGGFNLIATTPNGQAIMGTWSNLGTSVKQVGSELTHSNNAARSWGADWTAPSSGAGSVKFSIAVLFGNGNNANTGDSWATNTVTLTEAAGQSNTAPSVSNLILTPSNPTILTGLALTYTYSDADGDAQSGTTIHWYNNGIMDSSKGGQMSISVVKGDSWSVEVTPSDGQDAGTMVSAGPVIVGNALPTAQSVQLTPNSPDETSTLSASYQYSDPDQDTESGSSIVWYLDGTRVAELDDATAVSSLMTRSEDQWQFGVTPHDGSDAGSEVLSNLVVIGSSNQAPTIPSAQITPNPSTTSDDLDAIWTFADSDAGDSQLDLEINWYRNSVHMVQYDNVDPLPSSATIKGEIWHFTVRVSDGISWSSIFTTQSITISNTAPVVTDVNLSPQDATSSDDLQVSVNYSDLDGDLETTQSTIRWYRHGQLQSNYNNMQNIPASATVRGDEWVVRYTPNDGTISGNEIQSSPITIGNSLALLTSISLTENATALSPLELTIETSDADLDEVTMTLQWMRDGFHVGALDNVTTVTTEWLDVGQSWTVSVVLSDNFDISPMVTSEATVIDNLLPTAEFTAGDTVLIEAMTQLDGSLSTDSDGEIVAWFWNVGTTSYAGEKVSVILTDPLTIVNLTVIDSNGGTSSQEYTITASWGPIASNLEASVSNGAVNLNWNWEGDATTFTVWRTHEPIVHSSGLLEIESVGQTNSTTWSEPLHLAGNYHYTVTADVGDVHNPRISSNTVSVALDVSQMPQLEPAGDSSLGTTMTSLLAFLLIFGALATALIDRFLGRNA
ncbi:MAG: hypothetical protein P8Q90_03800 [Candidatus Thalassarchaeaceae archaeon]|nr:hypothetical protein [Candidatus Thalassarchaeaceae archaeon]